MTSAFGPWPLAGEAGVLARLSIRRPPPIREAPRESKNFYIHLEAQVEARGGAYDVTTGVVVLAGKPNRVRGHCQPLLMRHLRVRAPRLSLRSPGSLGAEHGNVRPGGSAW